MLAEQKSAVMLLVADRALTAVELADLRARSSRNPVLLLDLSADASVTVGDLEVRRLRIDDLLDLDRFHADLVDWFDRWPQETLVDGRPFAETFRHTTGDSLWWTGPGSLRHPFSGPIVPTLRAIWLIDQAVVRHAPEFVVVHVSKIPLPRRDWGRLGAAKSKPGEEDGRLPAPPHPDSSLRSESVPLPAGERDVVSASHLSTMMWQVRSTLGLIGLGVWIFVRAVYARLLIRPRRSCGGQPTVVMSGWYPNHVRDDETGTPQVVYWQRLANELCRQHPDAAVRYLLHTTTFRFGGAKRFLRPFVTGWSRLRAIDGLLPIPQCHPQWGTYVRGAGHQWRMMRRYARFERTGGLRTSPTFCDVDVSSLIAPHLRSAVGSMAKWSRNVAAIAESLRSAGDIRGVLVHEEFYPKGVLTIAAARSLGIPTIGVQHGLINPQHTVYMPPPGHIRAAPCPDWFAAYGENVATVLCESGAYPRRRMCIVGAPRFDEPATSIPAPVGRPLLAVPGDDDSTNGDPNGAPTSIQDTPARPLSDERVILVTTETFRLSSPIVAALLPLAKQHPRWRVIIKLHPHDRDPEKYAALVAVAANVELVWDRLPERLAACDVLVTGYSTTAIEGLLLGRPVICADFTSWPPRYPFVTEGAALGARSPDELRAIVTRVLTQPASACSPRTFLQHHLGPTVDGRAAQEFAAFIGREFLSNQPSPPA